MSLWFAFSFSNSSCCWLLIELSRNRCTIFHYAKLVDDCVCLYFVLTMVFLKENLCFCQAIVYSYFLVFFHLWKLKHPMSNAICTATILNENHKAPWVCPVCWNTQAFLVFSNKWFHAYVFVLYPCVCVSLGTWEQLLRDRGEGVGRLRMEDVQE